MCKNSMTMPRGITKLQILDQYCIKCMSKYKREVKMFRLTFDQEIINESMAEALPDTDNTSGVFCIF